MPLDKDRPPDKPDLPASPGSFEWYVVQKLDQQDHSIDQLQEDVGQLQKDVGRLQNDVGRLQYDVARLANAVDGTDGQDGMLTRLRVIEQTMATRTWVLAIALVGFANFAGLVVALIKIW